MAPFLAQLAPLPQTPSSAFVPLCVVSAAAELMDRASCISKEQVSAAAELRGMQLRVRVFSAAQLKDREFPGAELKEKTGYFMLQS